MKEINAAVCLLDISGYTDFISLKKISLIHAEAIVTDLLEAVVKSAKYPLKLNKFEGDAVLLYTEIPEGKDHEAIEALYGQISTIFQNFRDKQKSLIEKGVGGCSCTACLDIHKLDLKCFLTAGNILLKNIMDHEEIAGDPVILVHRIIKNSIKEKCYLLFDSKVASLLPDNIKNRFQLLQEEIESYGKTPLYIEYPGGKEVQAETGPRFRSLKGILEALRLFGKSMQARKTV